MQTLAIISGLIAFSIFTIIFLSNRIRKSKYKNWKVGDTIFLKDGTNHELTAWSKNHIYIRMETGGTEQIAWVKLDFNKSASWRSNWDDCKDAMGKSPEFSSHVDLQPNLPIESADTHGGDIPPHAKVNGNPIITLTETECQIYLKQAVDEEKYEIAELIKKRMISFR